MKLISTFCLVSSLAVAGALYKFLEPRLSVVGTSVISTMTNDGKRGGKLGSVKLPDNLLPKQHELLNFAFAVAQADGIQHPQYLQGVIMQESRAGGDPEYRVAGLTNSPDDRYFGAGQIKLVAAKAVMLRWPEMWRWLDTKTDEELKARLILDDKFNVRVASKYLVLLGINKDPNLAITAYQKGPGGAQTVNPLEHPYTKQVKQKAAAIKNVQAGTVGIQSRLAAEAPSPTLVAVLSGARNP